MRPHLFRNWSCCSQLGLTLALLSGCGTLKVDPPRDSGADSYDSQSDSASDDADASQGDSASDDADALVSDASEPDTFAPDARDGGDDGDATAHDAGADADAEAAPPSTWTADFTTQTPGNFHTLASQLGGLLALDRPSPATVQTSATTVDSTPSNDDARIGSVGAGWQGLVIEETRTNFLEASRTPDPRTAPPNTWTSAGLGQMTSAYGPGPDGSLNATRIQIANDTVAASNSNVLLAVGKYTAGGWARGTSGPSLWQPSCPALPTYLHAFPLPGTDWGRYTWSLSDSETSTRWALQVFERGGHLPGGSADVEVDLLSVEQGMFPTEAIIAPSAGATTGPTTRSGDHLSIVAGSGAIDAGQLSLYLVMKPKGSSSDYSANLYFWSIDGSNYAYLDAATQMVEVKIGQSPPLTSAANATWSAEDTVEWFLRGGGGQVLVEYRVGGTVHTLIDDHTVTDKLSASGAIDLLNKGGSGQFSCWLEKVAAYPTGRAPVGF